MSLIRIATANALETATVTPTVAPDSGYPTSRLYDRDVARQNKTATAGTREWVINGGAGLATGQNGLILAAGHNVGGLAYTVSRKSLVGDAWDDFKTGTLAAGTDVQALEWNGVTRNYWKLTLPTNANVTMTELFLTNIYTVERNPGRPGGALTTLYNVSAEETRSGSARFITHGAPRRRREYEFPNISAAMMTELRTRFDALGMAKPFFLCDHEGVWIFGILDEPIAPLEIGAGRFSLRLLFTEVL